MVPSALGNADVGQVPPRCSLAPSTCLPGYRSQLASKTHPSSGHCSYCPMRSAFSPESMQPINRELLALLPIIEVIPLSHGMTETKARSVSNGRALRSSPNSHVSQNPRWIESNSILSVPWTSAGEPMCSVPFLGFPLPAAPHSVPAHGLGHQGQVL